MRLPRRSCAGPRERAGFTLPELLVALLVLATVAGTLRGGGERLVETPTVSSWGNRFSPVGIAWGKTPRKEGKNGKDRKATHTTEVDAPAPRLPPAEPEIPPSGAETAPAAIAREAPNWEGWANPRNGRGRYFYVDRSKVVRYTQDGPAGKISSAIPEQ